MSTAHLSHISRLTEGSWHLVCGKSVVVRLHIIPGSIYIVFIKCHDTEMLHIGGSAIDFAALHLGLVAGTP